MLKHRDIKPKQRKYWEHIAKTHSSNHNDFNNCKKCKTLKTLMIKAVQEDMQLAVNDCLI